MSSKAVLIATMIFISSAFALAQDNQENSNATSNVKPTPPSQRWGGFVEPLVIYSHDDSSAKTSQLPFMNNTSGTTQGWGAGARAGMHLWESVFLAADGRYLRSTITDSSYGTASGDAYNYGGTLGFQSPLWGLRVWGTYIVGGAFAPAPGASGLDVKFNNPQGWRGGVGFHIATVSLNLEYEDLNYTSTNILSFGAFPVAAATNIGFESRGTSLSLSFPIEL